MKDTKNGGSRMVWSPDFSSSSHLRTLECFDRALYALATGAGSARDRLMEAATELGSVGPRDFPPELAEDFAEIWYQLTKNNPKTIRVPKGNGRFEDVSAGRLGATIPYMRKNRMKRIMEHIWYLRFKIETLTLEKDKL